ncbi:hypothetical protein MVEG_00876 [Podila verticillata NRRL 6337]|nr:hypothetical protein MVEG_00876 [Podila verticillata NRRL 6337]
MTGFAFVGASHLNKARKAQARHQRTSLRDDQEKTPEKARSPKKSKAKSLADQRKDSEADPDTLSKLTANLYKPKKGILAHTVLSGKRGATIRGQGTIRTRIQENHRDQDAAVLVDTEARWKDHHLKRQWAQSVLLESMEPVLSRHLRHAIKSVLHFTSVGPETMDIKSTSQGIGSWEAFVAPIVVPPPSKLSGKLDLAPEMNSSKAPTVTVAHTVLPGLSRSSSLVKPPTSQSIVAKTLEPSLPIEGSSNKLTAVSPSETPNVTPGLQLPAQDAQGPTPIIVRGFRSASVSRPPELTYPRPMSTTVGRAKELDKTISPVLSPRFPDASRQTVTPASKPSQIPERGAITTTPLPSSDSAAIEQQHQQQQQSSHPQSKPSRLWSRVRKAVNGGFSPTSTSISSIYQSAGGIASNLRSMSDTHLPYRPTSSTSTSSFNAAMPSFSSSVLSLLSDDQMSTIERLPITASRHPSLAFETPPETAPSSPVLSSKHGRQHFLPDLARRSSTKSPVAKAELTTAESNVSHFVAARREEGRARSNDSRPESMVQELGIRLEQGLIPKSPRSSRLSMGSTHTRSSSHRPDEARSSSEEIPLSNRNSSLSIEQLGTVGNINQDFDQFLTIHQGYIAPTISLQDEPKSPRHSTEIQRERMAALSKIEGRTDDARNSLINSSEEDQRASRMLLAPSADLLNPTKQDRRKSAISFGTYFSGPSTAARRVRDMDQSISGVETGSKGEIIHMRRTSFFDRPSSPRAESSISPSYPPSSLKVGPSSNYPISHSASVGTQLQDAQQDDGRTSTSTFNAPKGTYDSRRKKIPLKISPLVITGVSSLPSPMVAPMSAIPRQITLDRYFFTADQVHEWNIPSYGRVKFTDHAPIVFQAVRERFQYTLQDLDEALSQPMTVMRTPGKSDAVFFVSHNHGRFLLKTLRGSEPENLKNFLSDYMAHIHKHPNTLLPRYLGMYTFEKLSSSKIGGAGVPVGHHHGGSHHYGRDGDRDSSFSFKGSGPGGRHDSAASHHHLHLNGTLLSGKDDGLPSKVVVVVLANVFDTANLVHERYDFKGSNVGRRTLSEQPPLTTVVPPTPTTDHSIGLDIPGADLFRRHSQRNQRRQEANFSRAQNAQNDSLGSSSIAPEATKEEISNLTLKEMDFQNRVNNGQTHLIHVGMAKRTEILSQLEDDTALLRKHGFMDYSMLVGIHIVPKAATVASDMSESSGGSQGSMGSDADFSNMDDDDDDGASSGEENKATASVPDSKLEALDRLLAVMNTKGLLSHEQAAYLKKLKTATEETILEVVEMVRGSGEVDICEDDTNKETVQDGSDEPLDQASKRQRSKDPSDWGAFRTPAGTIRQNPKSDAPRRVRPKIGGSKSGVRTHLHRRHQSRPLHRGSTSQDRSVPFKQRARDVKRPTSPLQHKIPLPMLFSTDSNNSTWSQGVPSVDLPDGYEAVYYFGLIDILQRYNIVKWLERNLKGANARLLGPTTPSSSLAPPNVLSPHHPGRTTPSTSFSASSLYQFLPGASSESSLPLVESSYPPSSTLSVLMENPASRPTSTVSLMNYHRHSLSADKSSTGATNTSLGSSSHHHLSHSSTQNSSSGLSASKSATGLSRLSQISHHSHSSQPSHDSGKSVSMSHLYEPHQGESALGSSPPLSVPLSSSPQALSGIQEQTQAPTQMPRHQSQPSYQAFNQHTEVSVEEPGRYAERLVDFMRGVLV